MKVEDLASIPDHGIDRELIRGELREWPAFFDTPLHGRVRSLIGYRLESWVRDQSQLGGTVAGAGFCLRQDPDTLVAIDVAYVSAEMEAGIHSKMKFFDGPPVLAVEVLAPWDTQERIVEKVKGFLKSW